jgi:hypothetical protein
MRAENQKNEAAELTRIAQEMVSKQKHNDKRFVFFDFNHCRMMYFMPTQALFKIDKDLEGVILDLESGRTTTEIIDSINDSALIPKAKKTILTYSSLLEEMDK